MNFVIDTSGSDIRLENAGILNNLESKVSHLEPIQQCQHPDSNHVFDGGGSNDDSNIDNGKRINCTLWDVTLQANVLQNDLQCMLNRGEQILYTYSGSRSSQA